MSGHFSLASEGSTHPMVEVERGDFRGTANNPPPKRVLVVDDESLIRWSVAETLSAKGYEVAEAADAVSAVGGFSKPATRADVVLLDVRLPDSNDLRVLATLRRLAPGTPVIVMTAYGTPELMKEALEMGAFTVISKPFEMNDLASLVEGALAARVH